jgi:hypothetical protein
MKRIKTLFSALYRPKVILWIGITIIVAMCLFPPWVTKDKAGTVVYACLFSNELDRWSYSWRGSYYPPPAYQQFLWRMFSRKPSGFPLGHIDLVRLIIQCGIVSLITGGLLYTLKDKKTKGSGK